MTFGKVSRERLDTCNYQLQKVMKLAIQRTFVDFGIAEGNRSLERQKELFAKGLTTKDGVITFSKHNSMPSMAVDIFGWVNGKECYTVAVMCYLAGVIQSCAAELNIPIRWGGNWDQDGEIITDQTFQDLPHFELV